MLKIVYGGGKYYHFDSEQGYSFEHSNIYDSLRRIPNVEVIYFEYDQVKQIGKERLNLELVELVKKEKPDIFLSLMYYEDLTLETLDQLRDLTLTLGFFVDDHWHFDNSSKIAAPHLSWIATTYSPAVEWYKKLGCQNVIRTHLGANHKLFKPKFEIRNSKLEINSTDVGFVGAWYVNRERVIDCLQKAGIKVAVWGPDWPNGRLADDLMLSVVHQTKINIDINPPSSHIGLKPLARIFFKITADGIRLDFNNFFNNIREWRQKRTPMIKPRTFNCLAAKSFIITQMTHDLSEFYEIGKEIVAYNSVDELIDKIRYYLTHDDEREKIAAAGYARTLRDHTYEKRFNDIFRTIGLADKVREE